MKGISSINIVDDVALITFSGIPSGSRAIANIFTEFSNKEINLDMISQTASKGSTIDVSFTANSKDIVKILEVTKKFKDKYKNIAVSVTEGNSKIQFYGDEMKELCGVAAKVLSLIAQTETEINLITTSEVDISVLISTHNTADVMKMFE